MAKQKIGDFYRELDRSRERAGSCNCASLAVFFVILAVVVEAGLFYFFRNIKINPQNPVSTSKVGELNSSFSKTDTGGGSFSLVVSQGTICEKLLLTGKYRDLTCSFSEDGLEIDGKLGSLLPSNATALLYPKANNGKFEFEVRRVTIGKIPVARVLAQPAATAVGKAIYAGVPELEQAEVQRVELREGMMIVTAKKKN